MTLEPIRSQGCTRVAGGVPRAALHDSDRVATVPQVVLTGRGVPRAFSRDGRDVLPAGLRLACLSLERHHEVLALSHLIRTPHQFAPPRNLTVLTPP